MRPTTFRLFWKIFLYHLTSLIVLGLILAGLVGVLIRKRPGGTPERSIDYVASILEDSQEDPVSLEREISRLQTKLQMKVSVYSQDRTLRASNVEPPLSLPPPEQLAHLARGWPPDFLSVVAIKGGYVCLLFEPPPLPSSLELLLAALISIGFVALMSIFPARNFFVKPMEDLAFAAKRFGGGDLAARATPAKADEIGQVARAFNEMAERISQLLLIEKEMLANVSHELKTPLARIRVLLDLATEEAEEATDQNRYVKEIVSDLAELEHLVDDILTTTRLDITARRTGEPVPLRRHPADIKELLERSVARFRGLHPHRELRLSLSPMPSLSADASLLRRALDNLLDNAQKYSSPNTPIAIRARCDNGVLLIEVIDQGVGIKPAELSQLFTPFYRGDKNRTQSVGGVGLGLVLCRRIIEAHSGSISVSSAPDTGTVFRISLPL